MKVQQHEVTLTVLTPSVPGNFLTQKDTSDSDRFFSESVYLGLHDSADRYQEVTPEERADIEAKDEVARQEKEHEAPASSK